MRAADLANRNIVIWGLGREGKAAATFIRKLLPRQALTFVDENPDAAVELPANTKCVTGAEPIKAALNAADVIVKSPGVSLYHPLLQSLRDKVTSLLNLWLAEPRKAMVIGVTGTKGKSTVSALLAHTFAALGKKAAAVGNIGTPVTEIQGKDFDFIVVEVSSYQAADFSGLCNIGILTSLYPEHLDWHKSLNAYYRDKFNLIAHSQNRIINHEALDILRQQKIDPGTITIFNHPSALHAKDGQIFDRDMPVGTLRNEHLSRPHNLENVCAVLTVMGQLGFNLQSVLQGMESFRGLPHRQQELGSRDGLLFVDDSISTTPQSAIAAMEAYAGRTITLIAGGYDRGIDYDPLVTYIATKKINAVMCLGASGQRIFEALEKTGFKTAYLCASMQEAVTQAKATAPQGGVVLLSPAAPSYGMFKDFEERGQAFAACVNALAKNEMRSRA